MSAPAAATLPEISRADLTRYPDWCQELDVRLPVNPQLVLGGNVHDVHVVRADLMHTSEVVRDCLRASGFDVVLHWHVVDGLTALHESRDGAAKEVVGGQLGKSSPVAPPTASDLEAVIRSVVNHPKIRVGLIVEGVHRLTPEPTHAQLHHLHVAARHLARTAPRHFLSEAVRHRLFNVVIWVVDREGDLPHWLVSADGVRVISIPIPTLGTRIEASKGLARSLPGYLELAPAAQEQIAKTMAQATEGMPLTALQAIVPLSNDRDIPASEVENAVRLLRSGMAVSPWSDRSVCEAIQSAPGKLNAEVLGQQRAVRTVVDVLSRAAIGLSGAQSSGHPSRPQGVLFLAGPTGVGKTELAKQVAEMVFGRSDAMARFDMSEFSAEHTEARLLGAPPGYVGHEAGGELTNAVRQRPFCLLLFDEIEKAHPRILDKFLQILEDGRLTDGSGSTVHFSETLIVFTSNLGIYEEDEDGRRTPVIKLDEPYEDLERKVRAAIRDAFTLTIGRPELLNRIGENNIVVFNFITENVARELLRRNLDRVVDQIHRRTEAKIVLAEKFIKQLDDVVILPEFRAFGGRAVGSVIESRLLNPLARALLTRDRTVELTVHDSWQDDEGFHLDIREGGS
ncbi:MAG: AAA family ATPase [Pseudonocardiaceae bacterium]